MNDTRSGLPPARFGIFYRRMTATAPQWRRVARWMLGMQGYMALWFFGILLVGWVGAIAVTILRLGEVHFSYFQFAQHAGLWFPFSIAVAMAVTVSTHVANGLTRRSFARGTLTAAGVTALGYGLVLAVGMVVEGAVYDAAGWPHVHVAVASGDGDPGPVAAPWETGLLSSLLAYTARCAGGLASGLLVGIAYYRYGGWKGTFLLPLTILPALAGQADLVRVLAGGLDTGLVAQSLLTLAIAALGALAFHRIVRTTPIAQKWSIHGQ